MITVRALLVLTASVVTACSAISGDREGESVESANGTIRPVDTETLGTILVHRPPAGGVLGFVLKVDGTTATPEQPLRVKEGAHVLSLSQEGADWGTVARPAAVLRRVQVKRNETTSVDLSAMTFAFKAPDLTEGDLNVLPPPTFELTLNNVPFPRDCVPRAWSCTVNSYRCQPSGNGSTCWDWPLDGRSTRGTYATQGACVAACAKESSGLAGPADPRCAQPSDPVCDQPEIASLVRTSSALGGVWSGTSSASVALLAGPYTVSSPVGAVAVALSPGAFQVVSQGAGRAVTRASIVVTPPTRELPNARNDQLVLKLPGAGKNQAAVDTRSPYTVKAVGFATSTNNASAMLGPRTMPLSLRDGQTSTLALGRVDVAHVLITRENGSSYSARGTYTVTCITDGVAIGNFATETGIDVLPGEYRVDLAYSTEEGPKAQTFRLRF